MNESNTTRMREHSALRYEVCKCVSMQNACHMANHYHRKAGSMLPSAIRYQNTPKQHNSLTLSPTHGCILVRTGRLGEGSWGGRRIRSVVLTWALGGGVGCICIAMHACMADGKKARHAGRDCTDCIPPCSTDDNGQKQLSYLKRGGEGERRRG